MAAAAAATSVACCMPLIEAALACCRPGDAVRAAADNTMMDNGTMKRHHLVIGLVRYYSPKISSARFSQRQVRQCSNQQTPSAKITRT
jgi:hypothetical protein